MKFNATCIVAAVLTTTACAQTAPTPTVAPQPTASAVVHRTEVASSRSAGPLVSHTWLRFRDVRTQWLERLGGSLLACADDPHHTAECERREATFEVPYALTTLYRLTKDPAYAEAANDTFDRAALSKLDRLDPYALAWFLAFAKEHERTFGKQDLRESAHDVAARLEAHLQGLDDHALTQGILFGSDKNVAWALMNLWQWAQHVEDTELSARLTAFTKKRVLQADMDSWCPLPVDSAPETFEFFPPCLSRAMTVLTIMPETISNPWLAEFAGNQTQLSPIHNAPWATHASLNFSRGFGLWTMYETTGDAKYRDLYIEHVDAQMQSIERRKQEGAELDPWVAAFGVHAVGLSYDR